VALFTASLMCAGVRPALPTLWFFSMERLMSLLCLAWGVEGAEGACWGVVLMPGPLALFLFLAGASLKPSRSMPVAVMAAQVCLMALLEGVVVAVVLVAVVLVLEGGMLSWLLFVARVFGVFGLLLRPAGRWRIWIVLGLGFLCCCCCWGLGLLLLLLLLLPTVFFPVRRRFSIPLSLSSHLFSISAMMVSLAAWVIGASRMSCGMPVGSGCWWYLRCWWCWWWRWRWKKIGSSFVAGVLLSGGRRSSPYFLPLLRLDVPGSIGRWHVLYMGFLE